MTDSMGSHLSLSLFLCVQGEWGDGTNPERRQLQHYKTNATHKQHST